MRKPIGIITYITPWFIPLFLFLSGFFVSSVVQVKVEFGGSNKQVSINQ